MSSPKTILAWHWSDGLKCRFDGRPIVPGKALIYEGAEPIELCKRGLHASTKILDALMFAPGTTISRVRLSGEILRGDNKIAATRRETIWSFDATYTLISWAADCAERALLRERKAGRESDRASFAAIDAARKFVKEPSEANRRAASVAGSAANAAGSAAYAADSAAYAVSCATYAANNAAFAAGSAAYAASDAASAASYAVYAARNAASAARNAAEVEGKDETAAYESERKWQSARLRNLIAAGRRPQL